MLPVSLSRTGMRFNRGTLDSVVSSYPIAFAMLRNKSTRFSSLLNGMPFNFKSALNFSLLMSSSLLSLVAVNAPIRVFLLTRRLYSNSFLDH